MKHAVATAAFFFAALVITRAQSGVTGVWQGEVQPNAFWTVELKPDGTRLTGTVGMGGDPVEFSDGRIAGDTVSFALDSPDGDRTITFNGTVLGDEIAFTREVQVRQGGFQGGPGILGAGGPRTFTLRRVPQGQTPRKGRGSSYPSQLIVYDRQGNVVRKLGEPDNYFQPVFSPDGTKLAVTLRSDIWIFDVARGIGSPLMTTPRFEFSPVWSPDSRYVAYSSFRQNTSRLYRKPVDGSGDEELLFENKPGVGMTLFDWSPDGRVLIYGSGGVMFTVTIEGERKPMELAREEFSMTGGRFAPDSRFLAYRSDESGRSEVFVRAFDPSSGFVSAGGKWQVSKGGMGIVRWRRDGRELLYLSADGAITSLEVTTNPFTVGASRPLFRVPDAFPLIFTPGQLGGMSADGQRVALAVPVPPSRKTVTVAPEILSTYTGIYELFGQEAKFTVEDNQLIAVMFGERIPLFAQSETTFHLKWVSAEIDFVKGENGTVPHLLYYQGGPPTKAVRKQ